MSAGYNFGIGMVSERLESLEAAVREILERINKPVSPVVEKAVAVKVPKVSETVAGVK